MIGEYQPTGEYGYLIGVGSVPKFDNIHGVRLEYNYYEKYWQLWIDSRRSAVSIEKDVCHKDVTDWQINGFEYSANITITCKCE